MFNKWFLLSANDFYMFNKWFLYSANDFYIQQEIYIFSHLKFVFSTIAFLFNNLRFVFNETKSIEIIMSTPECKCESSNIKKPTVEHKYESLDINVNLE